VSTLRAILFFVWQVGGNEDLHFRLWVFRVQECLFNNLKNSYFYLTDMKYIRWLTTFLLMLPSVAKSLRKAVKFAAMKTDTLGAASKNKFVWKLVSFIISSAVKAFSLFTSRKESISFFKSTELFSNSFRSIGDKSDAYQSVTEAMRIYVFG
jgi:hypothetical protein